MKVHRMESREARGPGRKTRKGQTKKRRRGLSSRGRNLTGKNK